VPARGRLWSPGTHATPKIRSARIRRDPLRWIYKIFEW
jgi:hypothetical protein